MDDKPEPYVPKPDDEVVIRYRTWGGIAELPCIWHSVEPAPKEAEPVPTGKDS
jgi:hypothetical protein